jgi:hypothetical protein
VHALVADSGGSCWARALSLSPQHHGDCAQLLSAGLSSPTPPRAARASARALINGVYDRAKIAGSPRVYWQTHKPTTPRCSSYDKVAKNSGFVVYSKLL